MLDLKRIDVSLSHGKVLIGTTLFLLYFSAVISLLISLMIVLCMIFFSVGQLDFDKETIIGLSILGIMGVLFFCVCLFVIIKNFKFKKKLLNWQNDFIELHAYSKKIDSCKYGLFSPIASKIQVQFRIGDKRIRKDSSFKAFGGGEGYSNAFNKYANRQIQILYSPKYDQVLILKDKKQKNIK